MRYGPSLNIRWSSLRFTQNIHEVKVGIFEGEIGFTQGEMKILRGNILRNQIPSKLKMLQNPKWKSFETKITYTRKYFEIRYTPKRRFSETIVPLKNENAKCKQFKVEMGISLRSRWKFFNLQLELGDPFTIEIEIEIQILLQSAIVRIPR